MAKVSSREDALLNAYLNRYKNAQASTVNEGQNKTQTARAKGAALLNATDKTLPVLKDTFSDTLQNIVQGASLENSLNNDVLNRQMRLAQAKFEQANDLYEQQKKAQQYAEKQAAKEAAAAAKAAAKAARSGRRSGKGSGKSGSSTGSASGEDAGAAMDVLFGSTASTGGSTASSKPKAEDTKKDETTSEKSKGKSAQEKYLEAKKAGTRTTAAKSYAEQNGTGRGSVAQPAQSRAVTRSGKVIGSSYAAAGSAPSAAETQAAKDKRNDYKSQQEDIASALKKMQSDADYRAELAAPGRKLTSAEVAAVNQYEKSAKSTGFSGLKRVFDLAKNSDNLSKEEYAKKSAELNAELNRNSALRGKAQMNGAGQSAQAFTAGLYDSVPFLAKASDAMASAANATGLGTELPMLSKTLEDTKTYDPLAATAGTLVGKGMQYNLFNTAMAGTPLAQTMGKAGNAVVGQAKKIPVLGDIFGAGAGDALGRILTDTTADLALDTLPTLADDLSTYSAQQEAIANGQTVDDALTPGKIAGNTAKNIAGNVAMNALPEIGGAVMNGLKNGRTARNMLDAQANGIENSLNAEEANALVDAYRNADNGKAGTMLTADDLNIGLQNLDAPEDAIDFTTAMQNELDAAAQTQRNAAQTTRARQLNAALAEQAAQDQAEYAAKQAAQNSANPPIDVQGQAGYNGAKVGAVNENLGGNVSADIRNVTERGEGTALQPGNLGNGLSGQAGEVGQGGAAGVLGERVQGHDVQNPVSMADEAKAAVGEWAESITGKDRRSPYTRRIESLYSQMQNGASRENLAEEAKSIALGVVRAEDYAEPLDETVTVLKDYLKTTPIKIDAQTQGELLNASGLKTLSQYNIQNGTHFSLKDGVDYDTAVTEVHDMMGMGNRIPDGNAADALMQLVDKSKTKPLIDTDAQGAYTDYIRDRILDGPNSMPLGGNDYEDWLETQSFDKDAPDYIKRILERDFNDIPQPVDYNLLSLDDNYQRFGDAPYYDDNELNGVFLNDTAPLASDTAYSYAADHLQDAAARQSSGSVDTDSPYYNEWMLNQGALRQQQAAAELLNDNADAMETAANRIDSLNRRNEELLGQDAQYRRQQAKAAARQAQLDAIQQEYEKTVNNVPTLDYLAGDAGDWQSQPGLMLENGDGLDAYTAQTARQTVQATSGQNAARPLNGSESLPENAVGAESTQYDRREVLNQDYANQRAMGGKIDADEAAAAGIGQQTHTVYSRAEGKDTAKQDFDLLVQQNGDILSAGRTVADELARKSDAGNFDASDVYRGYYAADQLQNMLNSYEKGSADARLVQAQIENLNRAVSAGQSKNAQALSAGRWAQIDEYTPIRKFEQITQRKVNDFAETRGGKQLESLASDVVEMAKSGPQDEEFTAFLKAQGVDVGNNPLNAQMDGLAKRIKRMADTKGIKTTDEQAKSAAASILAGGNADDVFNAMARKSLGIENLSQEDYDYVKNAFAEMADMPDSKARYEKELDAYKRLTKYMPAKTFGDKMESIRYLSMLGNTRTHARNVLGNVSMGVVTRAKDNVSGVMQLALPKDQRTKAVGTTLTADGREMVDLAKEYGQNKMYSVLYNDGKFNAESGLRAAQDTFTSKPGKIIQKAADINSALLEKEDNIFLTSAFGNAMASQLKARGYDSSVFTATDAKSKQALVDAAATALRDAKEATFHEDNFLSTALKNYQNDIKGHGVGGKILWAVGEGVLPFKKTPLNIAKNAMEYNIVGGTVEAAYRYATGASSADIIDAAAKGLTGTALMGIGGILAYNGLLNGSKSGDDRADAFNEMTGKQEYSINIPGKGTYTIDWASPASVPLLMGAEIANEWQNDGLSVTKFLDAARKIGNPILETTMLQGLNDTLDSVSYADSNDKLATLLGGTLGSYAQQYVPTASGQIARTIDPMRRSTYGGGDSKTERNTNYAIRKAENKIPGLSMNNEPYIDQWGREEANLDGTDDTAGGMFLRGVYNFGSPGYYSAENITPVDEYLQGLYGSTNDSHVYPEKASSKITVDSDDYYMTPEEKTEYAKTSGQTAYDLVDELRQNSMFLQLPEDQQSALVQDAYTVAKTAGGVAAVGDGVSGVNAKEYEAYRDGGVEGFSQYVLMKNATDLVRDEKRDTSGNDNAELNTVETWNTLYSQFGDDAVSNFVDSTKEGSTVRNISDLAGDKAVTAYMQAYSAVAKTLDEDQTPDKFTVGYGMQKYGLSGDDFARAYLAAYYKKDKNGKYPEKGGTYADKAGAEIYQGYGADALRDWVNYRATIPDTNGNGKVDKDEAMARLNEMDLTNELRRAYLTKTNKQWKNPY